ncbi:MAG: transglutaminase domain protein [Myxococcales bacterium]|nr:transglutaminase domain protein [Myxococcales bacterium]
MRFAWFGLLVACAQPRVLPPDVPAELPPDQVRHFTIWLGGARVGTATETETWSRDGLRLRRAEAMRFLRGDAVVDLATTIEIEADAALSAHRVGWTERSADVRTAEARRDRDHWQLSTGGSLPGTTVPAELVPLLVRRDGGFSGSVFLPARGFVVGTGRIEPVAPGRLVARLALESGPLVEATIDLDRDGLPARVVDGEGVIAIRATPEQASQLFPLVDLISATAIPIEAAAESPNGNGLGPRMNGLRGHRLLLEGDIALPAVPGQSTRLATSGVEVELGAAIPGDLPEGPRGVDRRRDITAIMASVRGRIAPSLGAPLASARDATAATAGDCTTFALAYAALATSLGIPTRVVTGLRVDGDRLVRHRWAVSWTGHAWIAVDAAFGAAPAGGDLIGLAVHEADDAGLVAGEAALTQVRTAAWN